MAKKEKRCGRAGADGSAARDACAAACDGIAGGCAAPAIGACNSASWAYKGDAARGCAWVAAAPYSRCRKTAGGVDAEDACPEVCGACTDCDDDASWYVTRGSKNKRRTCAWVAKKPAKRCKKRGDEGERAKNACYATCRCDAL